MITNVSTCFSLGQTRSSQKANTVHMSVGRLSPPSTNRFARLEVNRPLISLSEPLPCRTDDRCDRDPPKLNLNTNCAHWLKRYLLPRKCPLPDRCERLGVESRLGSRVSLPAVAAGSDASILYKCNLTGGLGNFLSSQLCAIRTRISISYQYQWSRRHTSLRERPIERPCSSKH